MNLHCVHLGDGLGLRDLAEPRKSPKHDGGFYQSRMLRQRKGTYFSLFPSLHIHLTMLHFNGLCRKSMWDRLHSGRKRVWLTTNKHYGQTAAAPKVKISANRLTLTLFWAEGTLLGVVIEKATNMWCFRFPLLLCWASFTQGRLLFLSINLFWTKTVVLFWNSWRPH